MYYENLARTYATEAGIDPDIFVAQINQESGFDPLAGSSAGAQGIAQIIPRYHPGVDPWDPDSSLRYAAQLMAGHIQNYGGDIRKALTAYHAGPGILNKAMELAGDAWEGAIGQAAGILGFTAEADRISRDNATYLTILLGGRMVTLRRDQLATPAKAAQRTGRLAPGVRPAEGLREIAQNFFGKPTDATPDEPFPGFLDLMRPFEREASLNQTRLQEIDTEIGDVVGNISSLTGVSIPPFGQIDVPVFGALTNLILGLLPFGGNKEQKEKEVEEANRRLEELRQERDFLLGRHDNLARFFTAVEMQFIILQNEDPEIRAEAQATLDRLMAGNSAIQQQMTEPVLAAIRESMQEAIDQLTVMTPEEIAALSGVDITEKLFDDPKARPIASYLLSTEQIRLSFKGFRALGPEELTTGEQIRQILMAQGFDSEEAQAYREDTLARVQERLDAYDEIERNIAALRTGEGDWSLPGPGTKEYLKAAFMQPALIATQALEKYYRGVVQPLTGLALYLPATIVPGEQKIERDMEAALEDNNLWEAAGEAWRANTWHPVAKFAFETIGDPLSYIGWGIAPKLLKPIPLIGRPLSRVVAAAEFEYLRLVSAPFRGAGALWKAIPKPASTIGRLEGERTAGSIIRFLSRANPDTPYTKLTARQTTDSLNQAITRGFQFPAIVSDLGVNVAKILRALPVPSLDDALDWVRRTGGTLTRSGITRSKTVLLDLETQLVKAADNPSETGLVARQLMTILGVEDVADGKGFRVAKSIVDQYISSGDSQARRLIQGDSLSEIVQRVVEHSESLTLRNLESSSAIQAERLGALSVPLKRVPEGIGAIWQGSIEKFLIRPLARSYLLFAFYHLWNVAETKGKAVLAGVNPFFRGNRSQMYLNAWADSIGVRSEVLLGRGRGLVWGEELATVQRARKGVERFLDPKWVSTLFREELAIKIQAHDQVLIQHLLGLKEMQRLRPKEWAAIQKAKDAIGWDFKFLPNDLRPWAQDAGDAAILRGPQAVRALPGEVTPERLRAFNVQNMLSKYNELDSVTQDYILAQAKTGRLFVEINEVEREVLDLIWQKHLQSPEFFAANFESMVDEILTAPISSWEDFAKRMMTLQGMSRGYGGVLKHQYSVAREASEKVVRAADNDRIWALWGRGSDEFGVRAADSLNRYITAMRGHIAVAGERVPDVELLMGRYQTLVDLQKGAYAERAAISREIFTVEAPANTVAGKRLRSSHEWWTGAKERMGRPFRDISATEEALVREIYTIEARIGEQAKYALPDVSARTISRMDIAAIYNIRPDDVSAMTFITDLQAIMGKDAFVQDVLSRTTLNMQPGQDLAALGWTSERIGGVWDDIMRELRLDPDNVSVIAPVLMQVEDMKRELMDIALKSELSEEASAAFTKWADDLAGRLGNIEGYAAGAGVPGPIYTLPDLPEGVVVLSKTFDRGLSHEVRIGTLRLTLSSRTRNRVLLSDLFQEGEPSSGAFKALIRFLEAFQKANPGISLITSPANERLAGFYRRLLGFVDDPTIVPEGMIGLRKPAVGAVELEPEVGTTISWLDAKGKALQSSTDEFFRMFPDYVDLNYLDKFFRSQMPYWVYEWHRLWYLPRQFMRTPGLATGLGRYNEYTEGDNYMHVPFTSLEINPLRGSILYGGLRRLMIRDYPEFYDTFPKAQQALDVMGRWGFYPGAHITGLNMLFGTTLPATSQFGEIVPTWMKAPIQGFQAFAEATGNETLIEASKRLANVFIPERFRNYMIATKVSQIGAIDEETGEVINGASILSKNAAGTPLTPFEQDLWDRATGEMSLTFLFMDQTALFRFRPEEKIQALEEMETIVSEYTGLTKEQLRDMRAWGIRWQDIIPPNLEMRDLLNTTEYMQRWAGAAGFLFEASDQSFRARRNEFWDEMDRNRRELKGQQEILDCQFGFVGATSCDRPGSITSREWSQQASALGAASRERWDSLRAQDRYKDLPITIDDEFDPVTGELKYEGLTSYYLRTGQTLPIEHPEIELLRMYYNIQIEEKFDPFTGQLELDFDTFYIQREILLQSLGDRRESIEAEIRKNETDLERLRRFSYTQYLRPYYNRRDLTISRFPPEAQIIIRQWLASSDKPLIQEQLREIQFEGRSLIGKYLDDLKLSGRNLRFYSPDIDAWLAFWDVTSSFRTDEGQRRYEELIRRYRPGIGAIPPVDPFESVSLEGLQGD